MSLYSDAVLALSPNSYWRFAAGALTDSGSAAITLTATGGPTTAPSLIPSEGSAVSNAYSLDGATQYLTGGDNYSFTGEINWSLIMWVQVTSATFGSGNQRIISKRNVGGNLEGWLMYGGLTSHLTVDYDPGAASPEGFTTATVLPLGETHFLGLTWVDSTATWTLYRDGVEINNKTSWTLPPGFPVTTGLFTIGAQSGGTTPFGGIVDDVAVWSGTALTAPQILSLYDVGNAPPAGSFQPRATMTSRGVGW